MNPIEIDKIKSLVQVSTILSASEKAEWLALLGLMNDRQLIELEKILNGGKQASNFAKAMADKSSDKADSRQQTAQSLPKIPVAANPPAQNKLPALSHILNLPKNFNGQPQAAQKPPFHGVSPEALAKRVLGVKPQKQASTGQKNFTARLKNIFSEKELPAPVKTQNLQPPSLVKDKILPKAPVEVSPKFAAAVAKPLPTVPKPKNNTSVLQTRIAEKTLNPALPQKQQPAAAPVNILASNVVIMGQVKQAEEVTKKPEIAQKSSAEIQALLQNLKPQNKSVGFNPGLNFAKTSTQTTQQTIDEIKQHSEARPTNLSSQAPLKASPVQAQAVGLDTLDSLTGVDLASIKNYSLDSLAAKIRLLIKQFGYFDVIFNLEKSPLFKVYLQTGLKLLSEDQDFERLYSNGRSDEYLTREDFEKFTDLLSKIQTST